MDVVAADPADAAVRALLEAHIAHSAAHSPETSIHTLDVDALRESDVDFFVIRDGSAVLACGALKRMGHHDAEVKSMHVAAAARGRGIARQMLTHLEDHARAQGVQALWLETGSMEAYAPARALYSAAGFSPCPPFGAYVVDPNSVFMTKHLVP